ncbi:hypothetical protein WJX73_010766 [Symbiochloris irregularis]|uniref:Protein kinase domain-containing protein n=1 Tax=Symbiochloris irregularis TaxID=706552 RepID=A0AAW1NLP1_9CHLO
MILSPPFLGTGTAQPAVQASSKSQAIETAVARLKERLKEGGEDVGKDSLVSELADTGCTLLEICKPPDQRRTKGYVRSVRATLMAKLSASEMPVLQKIAELGGEELTQLLRRDFGTVGIDFVPYLAALTTVELSVVEPKAAALSGWQPFASYQTRTIYTEASTVVANSKFSVLDHMQRSFFIVCNLVLEEDGIALGLSKQDLQGIALTESPDAYGGARLQSKADESGVIMQLCGELRGDGLEYGLLFTDECLWLARYVAEEEAEGDEGEEDDPPSGTLYLSECIFIDDDEMSPVAAVVMLARLARDAGKKAQEEGRVRSKPGRFGGPGWQTLACSRSGQSHVWYGILAGEGSTGSVYWGQLGSADRGLGRRVAVKQSLLRWPAHAAIGSLPRERLTSELSILQGPLEALQGSAVPMVYGWGLTRRSQQPFFVMEPLVAVASTAELSRDEKELLLEHLKAIHGRGVAHGDLHTGVIMRAQDGIPRITDFSAARADASKAARASEMHHFARALVFGPSSRGPDLPELTVSAEGFAASKVEELPAILLSSAASAGVGVRNMARMSSWRRLKCGACP